MFVNYSCGLLILGKITKIGATRYQILRLIALNSISARAPPQIPLEVYGTPQTPYSCIYWPFKGREEKGRKEKEREKR